MFGRLLLLASCLVPLAGCDQLGLEAASVTAARVEADGKAVGAACRHGGRAIEDCFALNKRIDKAAIYAGWREMDDYMRENKIEAVAPTLAPGGARKTAAADEAGDGDDATDDAGHKTAVADATPPKAADAPRLPPKGIKIDKPPRPEKSAPADKPAASEHAASGDKPAAAEHASPGGKPA